MEDNLVLLKLKINIPNLWENKLVKEFPKTSFTIQSGNPGLDNSFSGLLKIENGDFIKIKQFLKKRYFSVEIEHFYKQLNLFHYSDQNFPLAKAINQTKCILNWPIGLSEDSKDLKIILRENLIENLLDSIEKENIKIKNFAKIKIGFKFDELLTPKQKEVFLPSLKMGYYEFPKRINLNSLAEKLKISPSTLCVHLQKIESKIFNSKYSEIFLRGIEI